MEKDDSYSQTPADVERAQQDQMIADNLARIRREIVVMSGKGGVGKSTISAYLSLLLSDRGRTVGLLDVDLHGPSIPRLMGIRDGLDIPEQGAVRPFAFCDTLKVVSLEMVVGDNDMAVIWRGPMKITAIRQLMSDIEWGDLDFLIVDSPPGTGDEPLTVAQTIPDAEALLVTTPQEVSLADVRKSINFCRQVDLSILGVVENMSGYMCPHCGQKSAVFGHGGGRKMASAMDVRFLGEIPLDPEMMTLGDEGSLHRLRDKPDSPINRAWDPILQKILER